MLRAVHLVTLVTLLAILAILAQGTGWWSFGAARSTCSQPCPGDDEEGRCPPDCAYCTCCAHVAPIVLAIPAVPPAPLASQVQFQEDSATPLSVDSDDIQHIPKLGPSASPYLKV